MSKKKNTPRERTGVCTGCLTRHKVVLAEGASEFVGLKETLLTRIEDRYRVVEHKHMITGKICDGANKKPRLMLG